MAQQNTDYNIEGQANDGCDMVYLLSKASKPTATIDSASVKNGKFRFKGKAEKGILLSVRSNYVQKIFINDGTPVTVNLKGNTLKGSPLNEKLDKLYEEISNLENQEDCTADIIKKKMRAAISSNQDNGIAYFFLAELAEFSEYDEMESYIATLNIDKANPLYKRVKSKLEDLSKRAKGIPFHDVIANDTTGTPHKLSEWAGKGDYVLIDFWASWCPSCRAEMPAILEAYNKYHEKGFDVVGISLDQTNKPWKSYIRKQQLPWHHISELKRWNGKASEAYAISAIPTYVLIAPDGRIALSTIAADEISAKLKEIYGF